MLTLPTLSELQIDSLKLTAYLLNPSGKGASKAKYFMSYGFDASKPNELATSLFKHLRTTPLESKVITQYGTTLVFLGPIHNCPNKKSTSNVRSVWEVTTGTTCAKFVTAYRHQ